MPAGAVTTSWAHTESGGKATYRFDLNGSPVPTEPGLDGQLHLLGGQTYLVRIAQGQNGNVKTTWELDLAFK